jgi:hypothetical protein
VHCDHKGGCPTLPPPEYTPATGHENKEAASYVQARAFQAYVHAHPASSNTDGVFVYRQMCNAVWWYRTFYDALMDPQLRGYFLTSSRTGELCWQSGGFLNFANASAIDWYVDTVVGELLTESDAVSCVFFDGAEGCLAAAPHPSPSGPIGTKGNCTAGRDFNFTDADRVASFKGSIALMRRVALKLNANKQIPIFSLEAPFDRTIAVKRGFPGMASLGRVMSELDIAEALRDVLWYRYYEWFGGSGWSKSIGMSVENVMNESALGIPVVAHSYPWTNFTIGIQVAAFLIAQSEYSYFQTSASCAAHGVGPINQDPWTDAGFCWHPLYDLRCGHPRGVATSDGAGMWKRIFDNCTVTLDQQHATFSIADASGAVLAASPTVKLRSTIIK